jgi:zinc transporter ZupT
MSLQIDLRPGATAKGRRDARVVKVDMLNFDVSAFQSREFVVGVAVAAILLSALIASSIFRNVALALAAGAIVVLYLQGGVPALLATSQVVEKEVLAIPEFAKGLLIGFAVAAVLLFSLQRRRTERP